jgi:hypothetical protein
VIRYDYAVLRPNLNERQHETDAVKTADGVFGRNIAIAPGRLQGRSRNADQRQFQPVRNP